MYRGPSHAGRSKATANTVCQKCLQRDSYECTVSAQQRPYKARPSRTQQLLNPDLKPKLSTEVPNELLVKKGIADEILAKKNDACGRKPTRERKTTGRRSRSYSSDSVSTISTDRSPSPARKEQIPPGRRGEALGKRGRSASSESHSSQRSGGRNTRRRMSSFSPDQRGRRGRSSGSTRMDIGRASRSRSYNRGRRRSRSRKGHEKLSRSRSRSSCRMDTDERGPVRNVAIKQESPSTSPPQAPATRPARSRSRGLNSGPPVAAPQRERSLSPYSKRVALTRAAQGGR